jgi:glycosyltransferase involved in cell wall biosynthesis/trans-aconitate methyltransferase
MPAVESGSSVAPQTSTEIPVWMAEFGPQKPLAILVEEVNNLYHSFDAESYVREHPEIYEFLPALWQDMLSSLPEATRWRVLDLGCGAGFEAEQALAALGASIESILCYDPSPEMLEQCRSHLARRTQISAAEVSHTGSSQPEISPITSPIISPIIKPTKIAWSSRWADIAARAPFNLLLTNSVLHHLPDIRATVGQLLPHLTPDARWIAGHEPSARFYRNPECVRLLEQYRRYRRWRRFVDPESYRSRLRRWFDSDPLRLAAEAAVRRGLFKKAPPLEVMDKIVDFHVPHSPEEVAAGRGLDLDRLQKDLAPDFALTSVKTYFFLGPFRLSAVPRRWAERARQLGEKCPQDGANFCSMWKRTSGVAYAGEDEEERLGPVSFEFGQCQLIEPELAKPDLAKADRPNHPGPELIRNQPRFGGRSPESAIDFSLVLATLGRTAELANFLVHLDRQSHRSFELVVVDQNPDRRLEAVLAPFRERFSLLHLKSTPGLSRARNVGLGRISGSVVAFPDDDCWYDPETLAQVSQLFFQHPEWDGVSGGCRTPGGRWDFLDEDSGFLDKASVWRRAVSIGVFLRRPVVAKVGEFDERLGCGAASGFASGEETDYLLRAIEQGSRVYYEPSLLVNHPALDLVYDRVSIEQCYRYGRGTGFVLRKHRYPAWYAGKMFSRALGGAAISLAQFDLPRARYYCSRLRGRFSGWCACA